MTDIIFSTYGEEKFRIPSPFSDNYYVVTKCPTHKLEIKERKMTEIEKTEGEIKVLQAKLELLKEMEKHKTPAEEAFKRVYCRYPDKYDSAWDIFEKGYARAQKDYKVGEYEPKEKEQKWGDIVRESVKWCKEHPDESVEDYLTPQTPEQIEKSLREAFKKVQQTEEWKETQRKIDSNYEEKVEEEPKPMNEVLDRLENKYKDAEENAASYMTDEVVNRMLKRWEKNPPEFLKFELGKTLEELICKCMVDYNSIIAGGLLEDILNNIEKWLPDFQSHEGTQSASVIDLVDGYNDCLTKIKSKLRNKK
jgi:hypothetical protein